MWRTLILILILTGIGGGLRLILIRIFHWLRREIVIIVPLVTVGSFMSHDHTYGKSDIEHQHSNLCCVHHCDHHERSFSHRHHSWCTRVDISIASMVAVGARQSDHERHTLAD